MTYAKRDADGHIVALYNQDTGEGLEQVTSNDPDVLKFLSRAESDRTLSFLQQSDLELVRVVEDLIELKVDKNLILFTELPGAAQEKLLGRKRAREHLHEPCLVLDESEII